MSDKKAIVEYFYFSKIGFLTKTPFLFIYLTSPLYIANAVLSVNGEMVSNSIGITFLPLQSKKPHLSYCLTLINPKSPARARLRLVRIICWAQPNHYHTQGKALRERGTVVQPCRAEQVGGLQDLAFRF